MKVKPPKTSTTVELEPYEVTSLLREIASVIESYDRDAPGLFPLTLHDFADKLKESQR